MAANSMFNVSPIFMHRAACTLRVDDDVEDAYKKCHLNAKLIFFRFSLTEIDLRLHASQWATHNWIYDALFWRPTRCIVVAVPRHSAASWIQEFEKSNIWMHEFDWIDPNAKTDRRPLGHWTHQNLDECRGRCGTLKSNLNYILTSAILYCLHFVIKISVFFPSLCRTEKKSIMSYYYDYCEEEKKSLTIRLAEENKWNEGSKPNVSNGLVCMAIRPFRIVLVHHSL